MSIVWQYTLSENVSMKQTDSRELNTHAGRGATSTAIIFVVVSMWRLVYEIVVGWSLGNGLTDSHHDGYFPQLEWLRWSTMSGHPSGLWKHAHRTNHMCHLLAPPVLVTAITMCKSRLWHLHFLLLWSGLCALCFAHRHSWNLVGAVASPVRGATAVFGEEKLLVCPCHVPTLRTSSPPWFCGYRRHTRVTGYEPRCENQLGESMRFTNEKRSSHADFSGRRWLKKNNGEFTCQHFFQYLQLSLMTSWWSRIRRLMQLKSCQQGGNSHAEDALYGPGRYEKISWEWVLGVRHQ